MVFAQKLTEACLKLGHVKTQRRRQDNSKMIGRGFGMAKFKSKKNGIVLTTYDLCLSCQKECKVKGPPWRKLECPSASPSKLRYKVYRILNMTENELLGRIAYA